METLLHIGTDKTGSTAIQLALTANRQWLLERGVYVPTTGLGLDNGHAELLQRMEPRALAQLGEELVSAARAGYRASVISWEGMCRFKRRHIRTLCSSLSSADLRVLVYLREQAEIIQSAHLQWIEMNPKALPVASLAAPSGVYERVRRALFLRHPNRNYQALLERWRAAHPKMKFTVRPFDTAQLKNGDVIEDFVNQLGLVLDEHFQRSESRANPSIDLETALLLEKWRRQELNPREIETRLEIASAIGISDQDGTRRLFDKNSVQDIRDHYRRTNKAVAKLAGFDTKRSLFTMKDCWREEPFEDVIARSTTRERHVMQQNRTPTLWNSSAGAALDTDLELQSGWSNAEQWGVWSTALLSTLKFRLPRRAFTAGVTAIDLHITGKYYGANRTTGIEINGHNYGQRDLSKLDAKVRVATEHISDAGLVAVSLTHQHLASPSEREGSEDRREITFGLCSLSYLPITLQSFREGEAAAIETPR